MKELSIEEKAERYDEIIIEFKPIYDLAKEQGRIIDVEEFERIFPELKESEDEKIRKDIIIYLQYSMAFDKSFLDKKYNWSQKDCSKWIAWLEKQGEQDDNEDSNILQRFSFYSYKDEPNILYLSGLYVNEEYRNKGIGTKILEVTDEVAKSLNCHTIRLKTKKDSNAERLYRTRGYNSLTTEDSDEIWLEKQVKQKPILPKWKYKNDNTPLLRDSIILNKYGCVAKSPSGALVSDVWVLDYYELAKLPKEEIEKQDEQKPAEKVEPKFKVGDWIVYYRDDYSREIIQIYDIRDGRYYFTDNVHFSWSVKECDEKSHLWTIQDAKDGDVLLFEGNYNSIVLFHGIGINGKGRINYHCKCDLGNYSFGVQGNTAYLGTIEENAEHYHPATKEQRDTLMKVMANAGYIFDFEKKELKKIEQKPTDKEMKETLRTEYEKGRADVIAEMQKPAWSEEDEEIYQSIIDDTVQENQLNDKQTNWLRDIKYRYFPKPKQGWSKEDEETVGWLCTFLKEYGYKFYKGNEENVISWLKFLKDRVGCEANCTTTKEQNIYKNGVYQETNGVRIWHNGHTFLVPKDWNKGKWPLLNKKGEENSKQNKEHLMSEIDALLDWDFVAATKHIQDLGTDIPLKDGEYLITAPVWLAMYEHRIALNKALSNIGAMEINFNEDFWFAERCYVSYAWLFGGPTRTLYSNSVYTVHQVGAVSL